MKIIGGDGLKRLKYLFLAVCVFGIICSLTGCKKDERFQTVFPLEEEVITATLEKTGLPGIISESETSSNRKGHIHYVVRSPTETYDGTSNNVVLADISAANYKGERLLLTIFDQSVVSDQIEWEDWKQQIVFATLLYGGFENEEDVYRAFLEKELPDGQTSSEWDAQLTGGYCVVSYSSRSHTNYNEDGFTIRKQSAFLRVNIYESYELYQKLSANQKV